MWQSEDPDEQFECPFCRTALVYGDEEGDTFQVVQSRSNDVKKLAMWVPFAEREDIPPMKKYDPVTVGEETGWLAMDVEVVSKTPKARRSKRVNRNRYHVIHDCSDLTKVTVYPNPSSGRF